jgi:hypothetical protein
MSDMTVSKVGEGFSSEQSYSHDENAGGNEPNATTGFQNDALGNNGSTWGNDNLNPDQALQDFRQQGNDALAGDNPEQFDPNEASTDQQCNDNPGTTDGTADNANGGETSIEDMKAKALAQILGISEEEAKNMLAGQQQGLQNATFA